MTRVFKVRLDGRVPPYFENTKDGVVTAEELLVYLGTKLPFWALGRLLTIEYAGDDVGA